MKKLNLKVKFLALAGLTVLAVAGSGFHQKAKAASAPKIYAVSFYADWCGTCRVLGPKLKTVMGQTMGMPVKFVMLDQSTAATTANSVKKLSAMNFGQEWKKHLGKTGFTGLYNAKTGKEVGLLTVKQTPEKMVKTLKKALM